MDDRLDSWKEIAAYVSRGVRTVRRWERGYALAGWPEPALHCLAIAVDRGFINHPYLARHDPLLESLRGDPRFQQLLETIRDRWERFEP